MTLNSAMYELREHKQQSYNAVCSDFVVNHNVEQLAKQIGLDGQTLRNMLNPAQPHKMSPVDLVLLCKASGDYTIVNTLFSDCGVVTVALPDQSAAKNIIERVLLNTSLCGELSSDAIQMCNAERLPRSSKRKTLAKCQAALGNLALLIADLEKRTTGLQPLIQMGSDFMAQGAPIPGFV
ncbi:MAG: phage regulatory CII family protein [Vibrio sp.]|uniref:phage regulatory CII family protein n=1 Tax=Vibrio sp. TaxID=678 RepID=UPI003F410231